MKPVALFISCIVFAGTGLPAQSIGLAEITAKYDELFCNRLERSPDREAFREKALMDTLYERILTLPAGAVREAEREGALVPPKAPWIFFNPQTNTVRLVLPPDAGGKAVDAYAGKALTSLYKVADPVKICTGKADAWNRQHFNLMYSFTVYASDRASLEAVRAGSAPLKLRLLHLEEKLPNAHDLYLNFTGVLEP